MALRAPARRCPLPCPAPFFLTCFYAIPPANNLGGGPVVLPQGGQSQHHDFIPQRSYQTAVGRHLEDAGLGGSAEHMHRAAGQEIHAIFIGDDMPIGLADIGGVGGTRPSRRRPG